MGRIYACDKFIYKNMFWIEMTLEMKKYITKACLI